MESLDSGIYSQLQLLSHVGSGAICSMRVAGLDHALQLHARSTGGRQVNLTESATLHVDGIHDVTGWVDSVSKVAKHVRNR